MSLLQPLGSCTTFSQIIRFKTSESSILSPPLAYTFGCKVLLILPPQYLCHPSLPTVSLVWALISFKRFLEVSWLLGIPASSLSRLQCEIPQLYTLKPWLLSFTSLKKLQQYCTVFRIKTDIWAPWHCDQFFVPIQTGLHTILQTCAEISTISHYFTVVYAIPSAWNAFSFLLTSAYQVEFSIFGFSSNDTSFIKASLISYTDMINSSFDSQNYFYSTLYEFNILFPFMIIYICLLCTYIYKWLSIHYIVHKAWTCSIIERNMNYFNSVI